MEHTPSWKLHWVAFTKINGTQKIRHSYRWHMDLQGGQQGWWGTLVARDFVGRQLRDCTRGSRCLTHGPLGFYRVIPLAAARCLLPVARRSSGGACVDTLSSVVTLFSSSAPRCIFPGTWMTFALLFCRCLLPGVAVGQSRCSVADGFVLLLGHRVFSCARCMCGSVSHARCLFPEHFGSLFLWLVWGGCSGG